MDEKQNGRNQSGYDQKTFGETSGGSYQRDTFGQAGREPYGQDAFGGGAGNSRSQDSYNYSRKYSGQQGAFGQPGSGQSHAQFGQTPPDGGAFYHSGEPPRGMGFGIASMVLGIIAIVLFCMCVNIPIAIVAVIFGIVHISRHTGSNGFAIAGIVTSIISVLLTVILTIVIYSMGITASPWIYNGYFPYEDSVQDDYDYYDYYDYDHDFGDDYFDGQEHEGSDF